jgi:formate dehydrogenase subunit delta
MTEDNMVHMANQIALFFQSYPHPEAVAGVTDHMQKFWERRMRDQIKAYVAKNGGSGLHQLVLESVPKLQ